MKEFLIENGFFLFTIGLIPFIIIIYSLPFYFKECGNLSYLISQIIMYNKIIEKEKGSISNFENLDIDMGFRKLPNIKKTPHYFEFKSFREQIDTIKYFRKIYKIVLIGYGSVFIILFLAKRIYFSYI